MQASHRSSVVIVFLQVFEISHQKVSEEEQPPRLAARRGQQQGELRAALLPDQPGRGGGRRRGLAHWAAMFCINS